MIEPYASILFKPANSNEKTKIAACLRQFRAMTMQDAFFYAGGGSPFPLNYEAEIECLSNLVSELNVVAELTLSRRASSERAAEKRAREEAERKLAFWEEAVAWSRSLPERERKYLDLLIGSSGPRA